MDSAGDIIKLLPDSVANQIAAGEVIQRPASVIKELVENSVDAGARNIEIVIKDAGKTLIQVVDDGKGMSTTDARMAFERHATSKIRCADDLFALHTMGFRGEALPSIAAVSELEVATRRDCDELGTKLSIRASKVESQEPGMTAKGTSIKVKNLFFNFVARRRFLKKDSIELSHIVHEFERLALVNTDIAFKFTSNGVILHSLPRVSLKERISSLYGKSLAAHLVPMQAETSLVKIDGFISLPAGAKQRGQRQFMFVNGRNMRHPYFHKAIMTCYENLIPKDAQPNYFINFTVPADRIDVNIHPQKHEIKFEDEQPIWQILTAAIREALGRFNATSTIEFNNVGVPEIPVLNSNDNPVNDLKGLDEDLSTYNPFELYKDFNPQSQGRLNFDVSQGSKGMSRPSALNNSRHESSQFAKGWEQFYESLEKKQKALSDNQESLGEEIDLQDNVKSLIDDQKELGLNIIQFRKKYIVTENDKGILLIDQHRAHVNVLFDEISSYFTTGNIPVQTILFPEVVELDAQERIMLDSAIDILDKLGFRFETGADGSMTLIGIPGAFNVGNPMGLLKKIIDDLAHSGINVEEDAIKRIILSIAQSEAIKGGQTLSQTELNHLVSKLFSLSSPVYTPDGLKVIHQITEARLVSLFN